jgi:hypothetical protein
MKPGTIFISHRSEYAELVKALKAVIQETAQGQINVFISEDIPKADDWRDELEKNLREAENLFLIYGAPYEDWSWCFYETGYFAAQPPCEGRERRIFCVKRKEIAVPSPLNHLQAVADEKELVRAIIDIYRQNKVDFNANELLERVKTIGRRLFGKIAELKAIHASLYRSTTMNLTNPQAFRPTRSSKATPRRSPNCSVWPHPRFSGAK